MLKNDSYLPNEPLKMNENSFRSRKIIRANSLKNLGSSKSKRDVEQSKICLKRRYKILKTVGQGNQGIVYSAFDLETNK